MVGDGEVLVASFFLARKSGKDYWEVFIIKKRMIENYVIPLVSLAIVDLYSVIATSSSLTVFISKVCFSSLTPLLYLSLSLCFWTGSS